ncbi:MAG TPA: AI-2E family transporter [Pseudomonadales bacterium]
MIKVFHGFYARYFSEDEAIIFMLLLILFFVVMMTMGSVIAPLLWSLVIAYMLQGLVNSMDRLRVPHPFAVYLVYFVFLGLTILVMLFALPFTWNRISELVNDLPAITDQLRSVMLLLPEKYPDVFSVEQVQQWMDEMQSEVLAYGQSLLSDSVASVTQVVTWIVYAVLVPILVFFMLKDSDKLLDWFEAWLPEERPIMAQVWHEMNDQLANYIRGKALQIVIVGAVTWLVFALLGLNAAPVLAVVIGISVIIPFVGATVVLVPLFIAAFLQWGFSPELVQVMLAYLAIHLVDANILVPLIFSETVNLHPIAIIAAILVFGGLWGVWGVFFAIPLATFIKATIRAWPVSHRPGL